MNREIKFRLRLDSKIVGYEKWYCGERAKDETKADDSLYWRANPYWLYSIDGLKWTPTFIFHNQKDTYTNLPDKNSKEIYEGDILKNGSQYPNDPKVITVVWNERDGAFGGRVGDTRLPMSCAHWFYGNCEVIGNIYEEVSNEKSIQVA